MGTPARQAFRRPCPAAAADPAQYNNTVRDLLGITGDVAAGFGLDEQEGGFAANSKAPLKELQIEKYQEVAEALAGKAVGQPGPPRPLRPAGQGRGRLPGRVPRAASASAPTAAR